jgi:fluoroacetyl-CoA thioesterase
MQPVPLGTTHTITYCVHDNHLISNVLPEIPVLASKLPILATGWLIILCEWAPLDALSAYHTAEEEPLGTLVDGFRHRLSVSPDTDVRVETECVLSHGRRTEWESRAYDGSDLVAHGCFGFVTVNRVEHLKRLQARQQKGAGYHALSPRQGAQQEQAKQGHEQGHAQEGSG